MVWWCVRWYYIQYNFPTQTTAQTSSYYQITILANNRDKRFNKKTDKIHDSVFFYFFSSLLLQQFSSICYITYLCVTPYNATGKFHNFHESHERNSKFLYHQQCTREHKTNITNNLSSKRLPLYLHDNFEI